jgi:hypothetical protein
VAVANPGDLKIGRAQLRPGIHIAACAEALALRGDEHGAHVCCRFRLVQPCFQRFQHGQVERIEFVRPSQCDDTDRTMLLESDERIRHGLLH